MEWTPDTHTAINSLNLFVYLATRALHVTSQTGLLTTSGVRSTSVRTVKVLHFVCKVTCLWSVRPSVEEESLLSMGCR